MLLDSTSQLRQRHVKSWFALDSWRLLINLAEGLRPVVPDPEDHQIGMPGHGWQQAATDAVHSHFVESQVRPRLSATGQVVAISRRRVVGCPPSPVSQPARWHGSTRHSSGSCSFVSPSSRNCQCGRFLDVLGHHRAACAEAGSVGSSRFSVGVTRCQCSGRQEAGWAPTSWFVNRIWCLRAGKSPTRGFC